MGELMDKKSLNKYIQELIYKETDPDKLNILSCLQQGLTELEEGKSYTFEEVLNGLNEDVPRIDPAAYIMLGRLCLQFGQVNRITKHPDGELESDTDHTFMLTMLACSFASKYRPDLDIGLIAQYATVHDFVEVYAGDTDTLAMFDANQKHENEEKALQKLKHGFDSHLPWISQTIEAYNRLDTPEARFVKFMDKILPKITHLINGGDVIWEHGMSIDSINKRNQQQLATICATYGGDFPEVKELFEKMHGILMAFLTTHQRHLLGRGSSSNSI